MTTESIETRIDYRKVGPEAIGALLGGASVDRSVSQGKRRPGPGRSVLPRPEHFEERELADLTMAAIAIKSWNRLAISFRAVADTYEPAKEHAAG